MRSGIIVYFSVNNQILMESVDVTGTAGTGAFKMQQELQDIVMAVYLLDRLNTARDL